MDRYEALDQEIYDNKITLYEYPLKSIDAFCTKFEKKDYICINKNKSFDKFEKYWIVEHELEHIKNDTYYTAESKKQAILRRERKTNDAIIEKFDLATSTLKLIKEGLDSWEICELLEIPLDLYHHILNYIKRKGLINND